MIMIDDAGHEFTPGSCVCEGIEEVAETFMGPVIQALQKLDNIICGVFLSAFDAIVQTGVVAIPGGAEIKVATEGVKRAVQGVKRAVQGVKRAVQGAKTFAENGGEASNFFGGWVGPACGMPDPHFDIAMVFGKLLDAPDSTGASIGCVQKKKPCRKIDPKPDPPAKGKPDGKPADPPKDKPVDKPPQTTKDRPDDKSATTAAPATTSKPSPTEKTSTGTSTTTAESCKKTRDGKSFKNKLGAILVPPPGVDFKLIAQKCSKFKPAVLNRPRDLENKSLEARADPPPAL